MNNIKLGVVETRFAEIIWDNEPIGSGELVKLAFKQLNWKKSTTYTVLKKLCDRGLFKNESAVVESLISKEAFFSMQSEIFIDETFKGSLPAFLAAFSNNKPLSEKDIDDIRKIIDKT